MNGVVVLDKPAGWTSHDAVNKMRRLAGTKRVGHLGTLDPMATGVLPLVIGPATRLSQFYMKGRKCYDATIRFGFSTDTYDAEGTPQGEPVAPHLEEAQVREWLRRFEGSFEQTPPPVSAKKIAGVPAYKLARKNKPVELAPVTVEVFWLNLVECGEEEIRIQVECAAGTYLRSIAHDLGQLAGCGAHLKALRRTAAGHFQIEQARTMEQLIALAEAGRIDEALIPAAQLLPEFPSEILDATAVGHIRQGRDFRVSPFRVQSSAKYVKALDEEGTLVAIGEAVLPHLFHPILVLTNAAE
ncbi:MAG: tRNA pseudouridine(55) synthase TruB [Bryobacter sp.]|jgi:tRNA pseudouridine55 synthase|nr:tRNA pseudouridine(55) synthase TruB [Bryobacter sp.]